MRLEVVEFGEHIRVDSGEVVHVMFLLTDRGKLIEVVLETGPYMALLRELGVAAPDAMGTTSPHSPAGSSDQAETDPAGSPAGFDDEDGFSPDLVDISEDPR